MPDLIPQTLLDYYLDPGNYSRLEKIAIRRDVDSIYLDLSRDKKPRGQPQELYNIVGVPTAGKSTLAGAFLDTDQGRSSYILIDNDHVRQGMATYQKTLNAHLLHGSSYVDADAAAYAKWQSAAAFVTLTLINRAQNDGFDLIRCGKPGGTLTEEICARTSDAGFRISSAIVHTPFSVFQESSRARLAAGGHPVKESYAVESYHSVPQAVSDLTASSDLTQFFWRAALTAGPALVATKAKDEDVQIYNEEDYRAMMRDIMEISSSVRLSAPRS